MLVVGLTGGIGCGKSEAARQFAKLGVPIVDVDVIARQLTSAGHPVLKEIINVFGNEYLGADGNLNRAAVRKKIFSDMAARKDLEGLIHPAIYDQSIVEIKYNCEAENPTAPYQILAISLLFENQRYKDVISRSLVMDCDEALQVTRTMKRSGLSEEEVRAVMAAQVSRTCRIKLADDLIENNGTLEELSEKIAEMHKKYIQLA